MINKTQKCIGKKSFKDLCLYYLQKHTNKKGTSLLDINGYAYSNQNILPSNIPSFLNSLNQTNSKVSYLAISNLNIKLPFLKIKPAYKISEPLIELSIKNAKDIVYYNNFILVVMEELNIYIYKFAPNGNLKIYKKVENSILSYYYSYLDSYSNPNLSSNLSNGNCELKYYVMIFYLTLINHFKYEAYFEAFLRFVNIEQIKKIKIFNKEETILIYYKNGKNKILKNQNEEITLEEILKEENVEYNLEENELFMFRKRSDIKINKNSIKIKQPNSEVMDVKKVKDIGNYFIAENKIFLASKDKIIMVNYE